jgi:hypothetical protein
MLRKWWDRSLIDVDFEHRLPFYPPAAKIEFKRGSGRSSSDCFHHTFTTAIMTSTSPPTSEGTTMETVTAPTYDKEEQDKIKHAAPPASSSRGGTKAILEQQLICEQVCAADVDEDEKGIPTGVKGMAWETLSVKNLRTVCARLGFKGYKNSNKVGIIEIIVRCCTARKVYNNLWQSEDNKENGAIATSTKKEVQCVFRLLSVLFSDAFAGQFVSIGDVANKQMLDTGKAGNDEIFWEQVQKTFVEAGNNSNYECLQFMEDEVFCDKDYINPGLIVNHNWKKLRTMWKGVNSDYKAALTRFTLSGTHDSNFFSFCNGKLETCYLRLHLERRPQLNGMVEADLPFECFMASEILMSELGDRLCTTLHRAFH